MERVDCKEARKEGGNMAAGYKQLLGYAMTAFR